MPPETNPMPSIDAEVSQPITDPRPEPGPCPTLYVCRYQEWHKATYPRERDGWRAHLSMFHKPLAEIEKEAAELIAEGCRNVRIVTIKGDEPHA